jgi:hypothetical protein
MLLSTHERNVDHTVSNLVSGCVFTYSKPHSSYIMAIQPFYDKMPPLILWAGSQATCDIVSGIPNCLNYCVICIMCTVFAGMQGEFCSITLVLRYLR